MKFRTLLFCLLTFFVGIAAHGQSEQVTQPPSAREAIEALKNGSLVVRLSTNSRKMGALKKMGATTSSEKDRQRFEKMLEETKRETHNQNRWLMEAFRKNYSFSKVLFMPDTSALQLKKGVKQGIFLNDSLEIDPSISLQGDFFVAYYGANTSDQNTNNEGITVVDQNFQTIKPPFPSFVGRTSIRRIFEELFNKSTEQDHLNTLVAKFQRKLAEF